MLTTRLCTVKVYNTRPVYSVTIEVFTEVFACFKVIIAFKRWTSFASIFSKLSSQNKLACTHEEKKERNTCILRVSQLKQSRLMSSR